MISGVNSSQFVPASKVPARSTDWLWNLRIALGELTLLDGDPGTNKSSLAIDLTARVTCGSAMPDGADGIDGGVLLLTAEDSIPKTVIPRLRAAGAKMSRVWFPTAPLSIPADIGAIEHAVVRYAAKLIVVDPLMVFLGREANRDQSVRQALGPLKDLAERFNLAVLLIRHLNKSGGRRSLYRGAGSIGIVAAARSALLVGNDPDDANLRILAHVKSNLGPLATSLLFEPVDGDGGAMTLRWHGESTRTADDLLSPRRECGSRLGAAKDFLFVTLAHGAVPEKDIAAKAADLHIAQKTLRRAKEDLGVTASRRGGRHGQWLWELPPHAVPKVVSESGHL